MVAFVGLRNCVVDLWLQLRGAGSTSRCPLRSRSWPPAADSTARCGGARSSPTGRRSSTTAPPTRRRPRSSPSGRRRPGRAEAPPSVVLCPGRSPVRRAVASTVPRAGGVARSRSSASSPCSSRSSTSSRPPVGFEALTRFADGRSPDAALAEAQASGGRRSSTLRWCARPSPPPTGSARGRVGLDQRVLRARRPARAARRGPRRRSAPGRDRVRSTASRGPGRVGGHAAAATSWSPSTTPAPATTAWR